MAAVQLGTTRVIPFGRVVHARQTAIVMKLAGQDTESVIFNHTRTSRKVHSEFDRVRTSVKRVLQQAEYSFRQAGDDGRRLDLSYGLTRQKLDTGCRRRPVVSMMLDLRHGRAQSRDISEVYLTPHLSRRLPHRIRTWKQAGIAHDHKWLRKDAHGWFSRINVVEKVQTVVPQLSQVVSINNARITLMVRAHVT